MKRRRPLPPPQGEGPNHFGAIIRRARPPRVRFWRYVLPLLLAACIALFVAARGFFHSLIFGGVL